MQLGTSNLGSVCKTEGGEEVGRWALPFCALDLQGLCLGPGPGEQGVWAPSRRKLSSGLGLGVVLPRSMSCVLLPEFPF